MEIAREMDYERILVLDDLVMINPEVEKLKQEFHGLVDVYDSYSSDVARRVNEKQYRVAIVDPNGLLEDHVEVMLNLKERCKGVILIQTDNPPERLGLDEGIHYDLIHYNKPYDIPELVHQIRQLANRGL